MAFVLGLIIGPAIGLLAGLYFGVSKGGIWRAVIALTLFLVFILFAPFLDLELKIGIIMGAPIGLLLSATPSTLGAQREGGAE
jgi:hypothetical protein